MTVPGSAVTSNASGDGLRTLPSPHSTRHRVLPKTRCLLPAARRLLPAARCLLPAACCLLPAPLTGRAQTPEALPVQGDRFAAEIAAIDSQWQVTFRCGQESRIVPAADLVAWGSFAEAGRTPLVILADGGLLVADVLEADKDKLTADSNLFGLVELPLDLVAGVVFHLPADRHERDLLLDRVGSAAGDADQLVLTNGDEVAGRFQAIADDTIRLETDLGPLDVETHRTRALVFNPGLLRRLEHPGLHAGGGFADGSRLIADRLVVEGESLRIHLAGGLQWTAASEELVGMQPRGGRVTYVSDLEAADYRHLPFLDLAWPYRADRNVTGGLLRSGGRLYLKGIGMHSAARLTYRLAEPYRQFQAELAIDDNASGRGSVGFRVYVDGSPKYASPIVRGGMRPVPVSVDVSGAKRLDLIVDYADHADELDRANWLDTRLVR